MGRPQDAVTAALAAEIEGRTKWDEPPALFFLYLTGKVAELRQVPVPDSMWAVDRPPAVLDRMSRAAGEYAPLLQAAAPQGLHGAVFRCEAWTVEDSVPGTARRSELAADAWAHRLHLRPDKVEVRSAWAVDRAGITYGVMRARGEQEVKVQVYYPKADRKTITGTIPEALGRIVTGVLGIPFPEQA